jgi:hypothetical protein
MVGQLLCAPLLAPLCHLFSTPPDHLLHINTPTSNTPPLQNPTIRRNRTWNPWDTPPLDAAGAPAPSRPVTCPAFRFRHPGTLASPDQIKALPLVQTRGPPAARKSVGALLAWAGPDLPLPAAAAAEVFLVYNPAPWDKARMTDDMVEAFEAHKKEGKAAEGRGAAGHAFSDVEARRVLQHTMVWLATGRGAHADKAVAVLDAW